MRLQPPGTPVVPLSHVPNWNVPLFKLRTQEAPHPGDQNLGWGRRKGRAWAEGDGLGGVELRAGREEGQRCGASLSSLPRPLPATLSPSGLGFLRQEFVLTTRNQENTWVGWPGVVTATE